MEKQLRRRTCIHRPCPASPPCSPAPRLLLLSSTATPPPPRTLSCRRKRTKRGRACHPPQSAPCPAGPPTLLPGATPSFPVLRSRPPRTLISMRRTASGGRACRSADSAPCSAGPLCSPAPHILLLFSAAAPHGHSAAGEEWQAEVAHAAPHRAPAARLLALPTSPPPRPPPSRSVRPRAPTRPYVRRPARAGNRRFLAVKRLARPRKKSHRKPIDCEKR
jgi:hypothetical protein